MYVCIYRFVSLYLLIDFYFKYRVRKISGRFSCSVVDELVDIKPSSNRIIAVMHEYVAHFKY